MTGSAGWWISLSRSSAVQLALSAGLPRTGHASHAVGRNGDDRQHDQCDIHVIWTGWDAR
jgi:hypothetical protein